MTEKRALRAENGDKSKDFGCSQKEIARAVMIHLQPIHDARSLQQEISTNAFILHSLFGAQCPLVRAYSTDVVDHIDSNFPTFKRQMTTTAWCTAFA